MTSYEFAFAKQVAERELTQIETRLVEEELDKTDLDDFTRARFRRLVLNELETEREHHAEWVAKTVLNKIERA